VTVPDALARLCSSFSLELTPKEALEVDGLTGHLQPGTPVYVTFLPRTPFSDTIEAVARLAAGGLRPVPHLAVRAVRDERDLDEKLAALTGEGGVEEVLLIAGSVSRPAGEFDATIQTLRTGCFERRGIRRVGLAGHPEGSPDISDEGLRQALKEKNEFALDTPMDLYLITQFCFAPQPIVAWERQVRQDGNRLPVHVGLPGLASPARLLKFGLSCGVGPSLKVLRHRAGGVLRMATSAVYRPDDTMIGVASAAATDPDALFRGFHFFPFGAFERTARWATALASGDFRVDEGAARLEAPSQ
jgi:methylenetetrahydrofolate reductase (NADPH)